MTKQIETARALRKRLTPQEVKVWVKLRELRSLGFHFRRQMPVGPYIVDFACKRSCLIVEIDGGHHSFQNFAERDAVRDVFLKEQGFQIQRFWNSDIDQNLRGVIETIAAAAQNPHPARKSAPPSPRGEGIAPPRLTSIPPREGRVDGPKGQPGGATIP